jgi:hypothetical protein
MRFVYGTITHCGWPFQNHSTTHLLCNSVKTLTRPLLVPTTTAWQRRQAIPPHSFRLIPFRSPLLRESLLLSFPLVT